MNKIYYCAESTEGVQPPTDSAIAKAVPPWDMAVGSLPNSDGSVETAAGVIVGSDHLLLCNGAEADGKGSVICERVTAVSSAARLLAAEARITSEGESTA